MKSKLHWKQFFVGIIVSVGFLLAPAVSLAVESINQFVADIEIKRDGVLEVTELIAYDFGTESKHGIYRDIPLTGPLEPGLFVEVIGVTDEHRVAYPFTVDDNGESVRIRIGDANKTITGAHTYAIAYRVHNAVRNYDDHTELYWNVTGNEWPVTIANAMARVRWSDFAVSSTEAACFTGAADSTDKDCAFTTTTQSADFTTTKSLAAGAGLTIVLGVPLGAIEPALVESGIGGTTVDTKTIAMIITAGVISFLSVMAYIIWRHRQPRPRIPHSLKNQPLVVEYNPPADLRPIEVGTILDRRVDITDISSVIMDLAVRGYLKIRYLEIPVTFGRDKKDFELIKLKADTGLKTADQLMFQLLFGSRDSVKVSELEKGKVAFQTLIKDIRAAVEEDLRARTYFLRTKKEQAIWGGFFFVFAVIAFVGLQAGSWWWFGVAAVLCVTSAGMAAAYHNKLTPTGLQTLSKILGFREFLAMTETDRLRLLNAPELEPATFEKWLAYAMVFGVEKKWAAQFEHLFIAPPTWYETSGTGFNSHLFVTQMALFDSSFNHVFNVTTPKSSSSGFSGSSGGGFGGGGGGSW